MESTMNSLSLPTGLKKLIALSFAALLIGNALHLGPFAKVNVTKGIHASSVTGGE